MTGLLAVELHRLLARRLTRILGVVSVAVLAGAALLVGPAYDEQARIDRDQAVEDCVRGKVPTIDVTEVGRPEDREALCEERTPPAHDPFRLLDLPELLRTTSPWLLLAGWVLGAAGIGAEWQAGSLALSLVWEPRRLRLLLAKLAAAVALVAVATALWQVLLALAVWPTAAIKDTAGGVDGDWLRTSVGAAARVSLLAAAATAVGFALASLTRSTAGALAAGFAWLYLAEDVVLYNFKTLRRWLVVANTVIFAKGDPTNSGKVPGRSVAGAALVLAAYTVALVAVAAVTFRRRDAT